MAAVAWAGMAGAATLSAPHLVAARSRRHDRLALGMFATTLLGSAGLLFLVEPMFTRLVLPRLGSSPAVWNTAVLFFQAALLAGYAYVHLSTSRLPVRSQVLLHAVVLGLAGLTLPLHLPVAWTAPVTGTPILWLLGVLAVTVGLPFTVVSATAPLLQRWFAGTGHPHSADPYFLYRASNAGSMLALLAYPVLIEPRLTLQQQTGAWSVAYALFAVAVLACGVLLWRRGSATSAARESKPAGTAPSLTWMRRLRWVALTAVPATWMLAVTSYLTTDVAPIPLLWVLPLALYLLSFALVFARRPRLSRAVLLRVFPFLVIPLVGTIQLRASGPLWLLVFLHLATFLVAALICHGEVAADRPAVRHLTGFYLWISVGGVAGGLAAAIISPVIFSGYVEYPLVIVAAWLLLSRGRQPSRRATLLDLALPAGLGMIIVVAEVVLNGQQPASELPRKLLIFAVPAALCFAFRHRPRRFGLGLGAMLLAASLPLGTREQDLFAVRDFFGVHRVVSSSEGRLHLLYDGGIVHGAQSQDPSTRDEPLTYYTRRGPLGDIFSALHPGNAHADVEVVGLGAGTMACYARPDQAWTFYELDPTIEHIARDPRLFTYLEDCLGSRARVVLGDARVSLRAAKPRSADLLVIDAFGSDAIPVHLITREAMTMYLSILKPDGVLVFHTSNQYIDLKSVLGNLAAGAGLRCWARGDDGGDPAAGAFASEWVVMAHDSTAVAGLPSRPGWHPVGPDPAHPVWSDDFSDVLAVIRWV